MTRQDWLKARRECITATDIAAILGLNPYRSPREVYLDKLGLLPEVEETPAMRKGNLLEPIIAQEYAALTGAALVKGEFATHRDEPIFGATPDYLDLDAKAVVECKYVGVNAARNFGDSGTDYVPDAYLCQVLWQMHVTGMGQGFLAAWLEGQHSDVVRVYRIKRDEDLIQRMAHHARRFWHEYVAAEMPPPLSGSDADAKRLQAEHPQDDGSFVVANERIEDLASELDQVRSDIERLETERARIENEIKSFMGDASALVTSYGRFTWKAPCPRTVTNWKAIAEGLLTTIPEDQRVPLLSMHSEVRHDSRRFLTPFKTQKA